VELSVSLRRAENRVKVLEEYQKVNAASGASGALEMHIADTYDLRAAVERPDGAIQVRIGRAPHTADALCDDGAMHVFHLTLKLESAAIAAAMLAGCPTSTVPLSAVVPGLTAVGLPRDSQLSVCATIDLYNTRASQLNSSNGAPCRRLAIPAALRMSHCINVTRDSARAIESRRPSGHCTHVAATTPGFWLGGSWQPSQCRLREASRVHSMHPPSTEHPAWLHTIGDSVTQGAVVQALRYAWGALGVPWGRSVSRTVKQKKPG